MRQQHLIASVLTRGRFDVASDVLAARINERFGRLGVTAQVASQERFVLVVSGVEIAVIYSGAPVPREVFLLTDPNARDARGPLVDHRDHAVVATVGDVEGRDKTLNASLAVLRVASVLCEEPEASAVFWMPAETLTSVARFRAVMAPGSEQAELPISVLARVVALYGDGVGSNRPLGLAAMGFHRFIGRDIEFVPHQVAEPELLNRYANIGAWLLQQGLVLKDGDTCGLSAQERISARYKGKGRVSPHPIIELNIERLEGVMRPLATAAQASNSGPPRKQ